MNDAEWKQLIRDLQVQDRDPEDFDELKQAMWRLEAELELDDRSRLPDLYDLLHTTDNFVVREQVGIAICRMDGLKALPDLLDAIEEDGDSYAVLIGDLMDLVEREHAASAPILTAMIDSGLPRQQARAAWLFGCAAESLSPEPLVNLLNSPDVEVRQNALSSLGEFKQHPLFETYAAFAKSDPDEIVRRIAVMSLGELGTPGRNPSSGPRATIHRKWSRQWSTTPYAGTARVCGEHPEGGVRE
jgi:hypothetical protein